MSRARTVSSCHYNRQLKRLSEQGYKEIVLLGQNVNSYHGRSDLAVKLPARLPRGDSCSVTRPLLALPTPSTCAMVCWIQVEVEI